MRVRLQETSPAGKHRGEERGGGGQLLRLGVCVLLFLTVFVGKGAFPERVAQVGPQLLGVIRSNTDFRAAFAALGSTMTEGEPLLDGVEQFCVTVFGMQREQPEEPVQVLRPEPIRMEEPVPEPQAEPEPEQMNLAELPKALGEEIAAVAEKWSSVVNSATGNDGNIAILTDKEIIIYRVLQA